MKARLVIHSGTARPLIRKWLAGRDAAPQQQTDRHDEGEVDRDDAVVERREPHRPGGDEGSGHGR